MNNSGDVAEQVIRMSLEGAEVAEKLTGTGALKLASIIYKTLQQQEKTKGKARLTSMLRSGKALKVYTVKEEQLKRFSEEAKKYGVLYCVLKDKDSTDGCCDVMVRAEDASKINRIVTRFNIATVDTAEAVTIKSEIENGKEKSQTKAPPEKEKPEKSKEDKLLDELMRKPTIPEKQTPENPFVERTENSHRSENTSNDQKSFAGEGTKKRGDKPSVREEIRKINNRRRNEAKTDMPERSKNKSTKEKER